MTTRRLERIWHVAVAVGVLVIVVAVVGFANASTSDVANQATLPALLMGSAVLGFVWGRLWWIPGLLVGATVAVQHLVAVALSIPEPDVHLPAGGWGTITLLVLVLPALVAAGVGAWIRRTVSRRPSASRLHEH